jgi:hypothetical protein
MALTQVQGGMILASGQSIPSAALPVGSVLQVVNGSTSTSASTTNSTYIDTGLTATITPKFSTSKILVLVSQNGLGKTSGNASNDMTIQLVRGSTVIATPAAQTLNTGTTIVLYGYSASISYLDSPATTSATTYKTQVANADGTGPVSAQYSGEMSTITLMEIAV